MRAQKWISTAELSAICGSTSGVDPVSPRNCSEAAKKGVFRGYRITTRQIHAKGRGGVAWEIDLHSLPAIYQKKSINESTEQGGATKETATSDLIWQKWAAAPNKLKNAAKRKLAILDSVEILLSKGYKKSDAVTEVANLNVTSEASIYRWQKTVNGWPHNDWLAALIDNYKGRQNKVNFCPAAWAMIREDYLRLESPALTACIDRARRYSHRNGLDWQIPSVKTVQRRINEIPTQVRVLARQGTEALEQLIPAQERDHGYYQALEAVNADGHKFDVFVRFEDGTVARPIMAAFQDIRSGKFLGYRVGQTENSDLIRLAFGDLVEDFGIPDHAYLDNGRGFASKWLTGGAPTRYRFKVKDDEPTGIFKSMGVQMHWCQPHHGQAKPIERAFRDLCEYVAKHPAFAGAYTGKNTMAKPENYGSKAVPIALFNQVLDQEIAAHNARTGRRGGICNGKSFDEVFRESYDARKRCGDIRIPVAHQRQLWLLTAEAIKARRGNGELTLAGNRYWTEQLVEHAGKSVVVRFDPEKLHESIWAYTPDGRFIGEVECIVSSGFGDTEAAREHARQKKAYKRATKTMLEAERRMNVLTGTLRTEEHATTAEVEFVKARPIKINTEPEDEFNAEEAFAQAARAVGDDLA